MRVIEETRPIAGRGYLCPVKSTAHFTQNAVLDKSGQDHRDCVRQVGVHRFVVPENFMAPSRKELENILPKTLWSFIPVAYEPTLDHFIRLCMVMIEHKPDFICVRAMSNSDAVIDMLQQSKGDRNLVSSLTHLLHHSFGSD